ncbi:hypothetical protein [Paraburkholderia sp. D1E]|uniref:hypothetical protein n=1 Tax=Paraburkholderia sp. D1E TaxID=3461398 RepID=UPI0040468810
MSEFMPMQPFFGVGWHPALFVLRKVSETRLVQRVLHGTIRGVERDSRQPSAVEWNLGAYYSLSKRTDLYFVMLRETSGGFD